MKGSIGRIIIVKGKVVTSNGVDLAPAIITRAWSDRDTLEMPVCVNCTAQLDLAGPQHIGSVMLYDTEAEALKAYDGANPVAYWPPRV